VKSLLESAQEKRMQEQLDQAFVVRCQFCGRKLRDSSKQRICTRRFGCRKEKA
jgi:hypothetical protein